MTATSDEAITNKDPTQNLLERVCRGIEAFIKAAELMIDEAEDVNERPADREVER
jgi:hypothetical protein